MDFGKLDDWHSVDFNLPHNDSYLLNNEGKNYLDVLLGATGWTMPEWKGNIYPPKIPPHLFSYYYSRQFATVEFNTTYYQVPSPELMQRWYDAVSADFIFCPKMFMGISQSSSLGIGDALLGDFTQRMLLFREKLGLLFMQLPQSFSFSKIQALERFCKYWRTGIPLAIELRHPDWFLPHNAANVAQLFADNYISWLITDVAGRRDVSHSHITAPFTAIRFVGNNNPGTDLPRISAWIDRLLVWKNAGVQICYFFLHSPGNSTPHLLSDYFAEKWFEKTGISLKIPILENQLF